MKPTEAERNIGAVVVYRPRGESWMIAERGVITRVSGTGWVYVRYGTDEHAKATHPDDLTFVDEQS